MRLVDIGETSIDKFLFNQEVLPYVRKSSPEEYAQWLSKRIKAGFMPTHFYDFEFSKKKFYTLFKKFKNEQININSNYRGSPSFGIIVPEGLSVSFRDIGHCNVYDMNDVTKEISFVPVFKDVIDLLDPESRKLILEAKNKDEAKNRETSIDFRKFEREAKNTEIIFEKEILSKMRKASPKEYANWLSEAINLGLIPTHIRENDSTCYILDNNTNLNISDKGNFCGSSSFNVIVPVGSSIKFNSHNHCSVYDMNLIANKEIKKVLYTPITPEIAKYLSESAKKILKDVYTKKLEELLQKQQIVKSDLITLKDELVVNLERIKKEGYLLDNKTKSSIIARIQEIEDEIREIEFKNIDRDIKDLQMILKELG